MVGGCAGVSRRFLDLVGLQALCDAAGLGPNGEDAFFEPDCGCFVSVEQLEKGAVFVRSEPDFLIAWPPFDVEK